MSFFLGLFHASGSPCLEQFLILGWLWLEIASPGCFEGFAA